MRAFYRASILAGLLIAGALAQAADAKSFNLKVVDEQGQPVPKFEAMIYSGTGLRWAAGIDGSVSLTADQLSPNVRVVVRATGFASTAQQFAGMDREKLLVGDASITLSRGDEVKLQLHLPAGMTWPTAALPEVYFDSWKEVVQAAHSADGRQWYESRNGNKPLDLNMLNVTPDHAGNFAFRLAANTPAFFVGINIPGFLQYFIDGPYSVPSFKNSSLQIDIAQPATLEVELNLGSTPPDKLPFKRVLYQVLFQGPGRANHASVLSENVPAGANSIQLKDIAPGNYLVSVLTLVGNENLGFNGDAKPGSFHDSKQISLRSSKTEKIDFQYVPLDPHAFHGNHTAVLSFEIADGKPAAGRDVTINFYAEHYGYLPVFSGKVPDSGEITLKDLTDAKPAYLRGNDPFSVRIGNDQAGGFAFKSGAPSEHFMFRCPSIAGDMAPDVELLHVADGKAIKLSDLRGKLVVLDFWATWCGPCQPALEKLDTVAAEKADAWKDHVVIVPVSIDNESEQARNHLIARGWTHLDTYWTGAEGKQGFEAPAMQSFVIHGVPTSFLIDAEGKILWRGHPMSAEGGQTLENRIEAALK